MTRFNPAKAFKQIRVESQREKEAVVEAGRRKREAWAAYGRRSAALNQLMNLFPGESGGTVNVPRATALMIEYAQTLPAEGVKACVESVSDRLAKLAADGRPVPNASLKEILLNLLLLARAQNHAKVAEIFNEAMRGDPCDVETFRLCLVNWLADKVVDGWPPLPDELKQPTDASAELQEMEPPVDAGSNTAAVQEWVPASTAVERAELGGHRITLRWLTQGASKHGVRLRPRQRGDRHKQEVELTSLAVYLLKHPRRAKELDQNEIRGRIQAAREQKRKNLPLD
jgi:hypothetical protein